MFFISFIKSCWIEKKMNWPKVQRSIFCLYLAKIKKIVTVQNTRKQFLTTPNILFIYGFWPILERLLMNSSGGLHELLVYPLTLPKILEMFCAFCTQTTLMHFEKILPDDDFPFNISNWWRNIVNRNICFFSKDWPKGSIWQLRDHP